MKRITYLTALIFGLSLFGCTEKVELPIMTEDEYPRIFAVWPDKATNGSLGILGGTTEQPLTVRIEYTPSDLCEAIWYLDGIEYCRGKLFEYSSFMPIEHHLELVVSSPKYTTSREAILKIE